MNNSPIAMPEFITSQTQKTLPHLPELLKILFYLLILSGFILCALLCDYFINQWLIGTTGYIELGLVVGMGYGIIKLMQNLSQKRGQLFQNKKAFIYVALILLNIGLFLFTPHLFTSTSTATTLCATNLRSIN